MEKILSDDFTGRVIDCRSFPLDAEKYPHLIMLGYNDVRKDRIGTTENGRAKYVVRYDWQIRVAPADLDRAEAEWAKAEKLAEAKGWIRS